MSGQPSAQRMQRELRIPPRAAQGGRKPLNGGEGKCLAGGFGYVEFQAVGAAIENDFPADRSGFQARLSLRIFL